VVVATHGVSFVVQQGKTHDYSPLLYFITNPIPLLLTDLQQRRLRSMHQKKKK
jgi:hypothetical protein